MSPKQAQALIKSVDHALYWTLRGGNDPEDRGNVSAAVDELGVVLIEVIKELVKE